MRGTLGWRGTRRVRGLRPPEHGQISLGRRADRPLSPRGRWVGTPRARRFGHQHRAGRWEADRPPPLPVELWTSATRCRDGNVAWTRTGPVSSRRSSGSYGHPSMNAPQIESGGDPVFIEIEGRVAAGWIPSAADYGGKARVERIDPVGLRDPVPDPALGEDLAAALVRVAEPEHRAAREKDVTGAALVHEIEQ